MDIQDRVRAAITAHVPVPSEILNMLDGEEKQHASRLQALRQANADREAARAESARCREHMKAQDAEIEELKEKVRDLDERGPQALLPKYRAALAQIDALRAELGALKRRTYGAT